MLPGCDDFIFGHAEACIFFQPMRLAFATTISLGISPFICALKKTGRVREFFNAHMLKLRITADRSRTADLQHPMTETLPTEMKLVRLPSR
jgi:hypothetical protein